jgi:hypothetical protein
MISSQASGLRTRLAVVDSAAALFAGFSGCSSRSGAGDGQIVIAWSGGRWTPGGVAQPKKGGIGRPYRTRG